MKSMPTNSKARRGFLLHPHTSPHHWPERRILGSFCQNENHSGLYSYIAA
jgi:hypothetical protein